MIGREREMVKKKEYNVAVRTTQHHSASRVVLELVFINKEKQINSYIDRFLLKTSEPMH